LLRTDTDAVQQQRGNQSNRIECPEAQMDFPVTEEQIRTLAFYLWEKDGSPEGKSDEYWLKAQRQLAGEDKIQDEPPSVTPNDV
jgi:Protein of unknown function (DUF2934)